VAAIVREIGIAVVKGMRLTHPDAIDVDAVGALDDRRFFLVDADGAQLDAKHGPLNAVTVGWEPAARRLALRFPAGDAVAGPVELGGPLRGRVLWDGEREVPGREVLGPFAGALSAYLGSPVRLVESAERAIDVAPLTLVSDASVARLEAAMGETGIGTRRFRMTLTLSGARAHEEDAWDGHRVRAGGCLLRIEGRVPRCVAVTHDPETGERDKPTLRGIVSYRRPADRDDPVQAPFGVYAYVEEPGRIAVGDSVAPG
jgi:uncharacterized protein YcbX